YSHWGETLYFSTSDNSDPNANGRRYSLARDLDREEEQPLAATTNATVDTAILDFERPDDDHAAVKSLIVDVDTFMPMDRQIERIRHLIGQQQPMRRLFDAAISRLDIAANQELIRRHGPTRGLSDATKYLDCAYWIHQKLQLALHLGLDWR